jgi:hypothetical protein
VTLTEKGLAVIDEAVAAGLAAQTAALSPLDDEQPDQLTDLLRKVVEGTQNSPE